MEETLRQDFLIYGMTYKCYRYKKYIGDFVYTDDPNIGDSFLLEKINDTDEECFEVCKPHEWEFA